MRDRHIFTQTARWRMMQGHDPAENIMKRVTGLGGIFFKAASTESSMAWYEKHLGITPEWPGGHAFRWLDAEVPDRPGLTVWSLFPGDSPYFGAATQQYMVNYRVENLEALLEALRAEGVWIDEKREDSEYGRFAWIRDCDGNRIELWEPPEGS